MLFDEKKQKTNAVYNPSFILKAFKYDILIAVGKMLVPISKYFHKNNISVVLPLMHGLYPLETQFFPLQCCWSCRSPQADLRKGRSPPKQSNSHFYPLTP